MSIFEIVVTNELYGQLVTNVFHYAADFGLQITDVAANLEAEFEADVVDPWQGIISNRQLRRRVFVHDIYNANEFDETIYTGSIPFGEADAEAMPPFVALAFRSDRQAVGVNRWYKRLSGVPENVVTGNDWIQSGTLGVVLAAAFNLVLTPNSNIGQVALAPVLLSKQKYTTPSGGTGYRFYASEAEQRQHMYLLATGSINYFRLTSQRSRLVGVGQ